MAEELGVKAPKSTMTKEQLRDDLIGKGYKVVPIERWRLVSSVDGLVKYDVEFASPDGTFATGQVVVSGDKGQGEVAKGINAFAPPSSFLADLATFVASLEAPGNKDGVQRIIVNNVNETKNFAEVTAYVLADGTVNKTDFFVEESDGLFNYYPLI